MSSAVAAVIRRVEQTRSGVLVQRLLRLRVVLARHRHAAVVLRRAVELGRKRLGILGREWPLDSPLELLGFVHVHYVVRHGLGATVFILGRCRVGAGFAALCWLAL